MEVAFKEVEEVFRMFKKSFEEVGGLSILSIGESKPHFLHSNLVYSPDILQVFGIYNNLLLLPDTYRVMGNRLETVEPNKPSNFLRPGPEIVEINGVAKERAA